MWAMPSLEPVVVGPGGLRRLVSSYCLRFPDLYIKIEDQIAEERPSGDTLASDDHSREHSDHQRHRRAHPVLHRHRSSDSSRKHVDAHTNYTSFAPTATCNSAHDAETRAPGVTIF